VKNKLLITDWKPILYLAENMERNDFQHLIFSIPATLPQESFPISRFYFCREKSVKKDTY
jgi:hypothetical protein